MSRQISASRSVSTPNRRSGRLMSLSKPIAFNQPPVHVEMTTDDDNATETPERRRKGIEDGRRIISNKTDLARDTLVRNKGKIKELNADGKYEAGECSAAGERRRQVDKRSKVDLVENVALRHQRLRIRNPPLSLYLIMKDLNDDQKRDIRELGFETMIDFNISEIPTILGQMAVESFDHVSCVLNVKGKKVKITKETINQYLGVPVGGQRVNALKSAKIQDVITQDWRRQFKKEHKRISACNVYDELLQQRAGGRMFKLNFLVLFVTTMAEGNKCSTVNQKFLPCLNELDRVKHMDWCRYILECLKRTKKEWVSEKHYNGPLLFLVVLYANTLKPKHIGDNMDGPVMNMWTTDTLFELQNDLLRLDSAGNDNNEQLHVMASGGYDNVEKNKSMSSRKSNKRMRLTGGVHGQQISGTQDLTSQPSLQECKVLVSKLFDNIRNDITKVNELLQRVILENSEDVELQEMGLMRTKIMMAYQMERTEGMERFPDVGKDYNGGIKISETQFFASPTVMRTIEQSEMKHAKDVAMHNQTAKAFKSKTTVEPLSSQPNWDLGITQQMPERSVDIDLAIRRLSFGEIPENSKNAKAKMSLGLDVVSNNVNMMDHDGLRHSKDQKEAEDIGKDEEKMGGTNVENHVENGSDMKVKLRVDKKVMHEEQTMAGKNRVPEWTQYGRGQRERRVPGILLSPYLRREVSVKERLCGDEYNTAGCVFAATRDPRDILFRTRFFTADRLVFESMVADVPVDKMAINAWSLLLNYEERLRNPNNFGRLFCKPDMVINEMIINNSDYRKHSELFGREIDVTLNTSPFKSLADVELVFFPLQQQNDKWYVICFNLKTRSLHVIDSCKRKEVNLEKVYGEVLLYLVRMLTDYLTTTRHPEAMAMMIPERKIIKMRSQTQSNIVDSGVFVMRHMEVYKGKSDRFDDGLETEGPSQKVLLNNCRVKFLTKMLTSIVNLNKNKVELDVEDYCMMAPDKKKSLKATSCERIRKRLLRMK